MKTLFHCLYNTPTGDALQATCEREIGDLKGKFLFAATHLTKSLAFAFSYHDGEVISNGSINGTDNEWVILADSQNPLEKDRNITVLSFSDEGFTYLPEDWRQCVSRDALPFSKTSVALQTTDYKELMQRGLQILVFDDVNHGAAIDHDNYGQGFPSRNSWFQHFIGTGAMRWINQEENINPCQKLQHDIATAATVSQLPEYLVPPAVK